MARYFVSLTFALVAALGLAGASVSADPPVNLTVPVDTSFSFDDCGFTVEAHVGGHVRLHLFPDEVGRVEMDNYNFHITYTNPATGETLQSLSVGPDIFFVDTEDSVTRASMGIIERIVVPGEGLVAAQVGRLVILFAPGLPPEVLFEAGQHDGDILGAICAALA